MYYRLNLPRCPSPPAGSRDHHPTFTSPTPSLHKKKAQPDTYAFLEAIVQHNVN